MGLYTDVDSFAKHIASYGKAVEGAQREAVAATAELAATIIRTSGARYHIRGRTGKKWPLGAKVLPPKGFGSNWVAIVKADPIGFWVLVESGAKAHWITPAGVTKGRRQRASTRSRGKQALFNASYAHPIGRPVWHFGTDAIGHPWQEAMSIVKVRCPEMYGDAVVAGTLAKVA